LEEERLGDKKYGSTRRGIAPAYGDKYMKKGLRLGDLLSPETLKQKRADLIEWKNIALKAYGHDKEKTEDVMKWLKTYGSEISEFVTDTTEFLHAAIDNEKDILLEAQLGALRDIDYGIYPYTTSSQTLAAYAPIGSGIPGVKLDLIVGVTKAYSSCVGEGPFTAEMSGDEAAKLREAGAEFGAATGRARRVGAFDVVASRYGVRTQGADELALTKLDILSYLDKIPVCIAYEIDGVKTENFPSGDALARATPVYEYLEGWGSDISKIRKQSELPAATINYVRFIEKSVGCKIKCVSVGAGRDDYIDFE